MNSSNIPKTIRNSIGKRFGMLTIVGYEGHIKTNYYVSTRCDCGKEKVMLFTGIYYNGVRACGCMIGASRGRNCPIGETFNRLTIVEDMGRVGNKYYVKCRCECGTIKEFREDSVKSGHIKSCGCYKRDANDMASKKWEAYRNSPDYQPYKPTQTYITWTSMRSRCYNLRGRGHRKYAGKGIEICEGWMGKNGYTNFLKDMGERPSFYYSIDRINGKLHYSCGKCAECINNGWPMNCRWATTEEQSNNLCNNVYVTLNGEKISCHTADRRLGFKKGTIWRRIRYHGWTEEEAITIQPSRLNGYLRFVAKNTKP